MPVLGRLNKTASHNVLNVGGFTMFKNAPVGYRSSEEVRELIIDWVERNKMIPTEPTTGD